MFGVWKVTARSPGRKAREHVIFTAAGDNSELLLDHQAAVPALLELSNDPTLQAGGLAPRALPLRQLAKRDARVGRNPRTGEAVPVEEKHVPFFKAGKLLRDRLNGG